MSDVRHRIGVGNNTSIPIDGELGVLVFPILDQLGRAILDQEDNYLIDQNGS